MSLEIQKADILKRVAAFILDGIVLIVLVTGMSSFLSLLTHYDNYNNILQNGYDKYEMEYGITFDVSESQYQAYSQSQKENYDLAYEALIEDQPVMDAYRKVVKLMVFILSVSILFGFIVTELIFPLIFKNGQTIGKKVFGLAVIHTNCIKLDNFSLCTRTILGKFAVETMVPVLVIVLRFFNKIGIIGIYFIAGLGLLQLFLLIKTKTNSFIHDLICDSVVVDFSSQQVFANYDELVSYKEKLAAEEADKKEYF